MRIFAGWRFGIDRAGFVQSARQRRRGVGTITQARSTRIASFTYAPQFKITNRPTFGIIHAGQRFRLAVRMHDEETDTVMWRAALPNRSIRDAAVGVTHGEPLGVAVCLKPGTGGVGPHFACRGRDGRREEALPHDRGERTRCRLSIAFVAGRVFPSHLPVRSGNQRLRAGIILQTQRQHRPNPPTTPRPMMVATSEAHLNEEIGAPVRILAASETNQPIQTTSRTKIVTWLLRGRSPHTVTNRAAYCERPG